MYNYINVYKNVRVYSINLITMTKATNRTTAMGMITYRLMLFPSIEEDVDGTIVVEELRWK